MLLLLVVAGDLYGGVCEVGREDGHSHAGVSPCDLFVKSRSGDLADAESAVLFGDLEAVEAHLCHLVIELLGNVAVLLPLLGLLLDLLLCEFSYCFEEVAVFLID